ncbi:MAG: hypothetical protein LBT05_03310 [Planctomycetaceae bacterium]|jgi:hypothetical protein|nr:hypothetical protein [Planctomycetaceae bacterium]
MNEKKYFVFIKNAFSQELKKINEDLVAGKHIPMTKRDYVNRSFKHLLKVTPDTFIPVKASDFIKDYSLGPKESLYMKRLGWDYAKAAALVNERGSILLYACHLDRAWRFVALEDYMRDDDLAFRVLRELEDGIGLETVLVEYCPEPK